jgi:sialate O-acetylesterase
VKDGRIVIAFDHVGGGLAARGRSDGTLAEFAIAGADRKFIRAEAKVEGDRVVVWYEGVAEPVAVRYAWADNPAGANLVNAEGLPASPFRTDCSTRGGIGP